MISLRLVTTFCILTIFMMVPDTCAFIHFSINGDDIELEPGIVLDLQNPVDVESLYSTLYVLCSLYNQCNTTYEVPEHVQRIIGCCVPCDCSDKCFDIGNCCMDKQRESVIEQMKQENCITTNPLDQHDRSDSYLMVTDCAHDYRSEAKDKCINTQNAEMDFAPVYSKQNGKTYRNIHCAHCNHQNLSLVPWLVLANCNNYSPLNFLDKQELMLQDECQLRWEPNSNTTKCFFRDGSVDCERAKYKDLCNTAPEGYGFVKELEARVCNGFCDLPKMCPADSSYQALLNWAGNVKAQSLISSEPYVDDFNETEPKCSSGETFNDIEKRCLRITCSPSQMKVGHQKDDCVDLFKMVRGVCVDYRLRVVVPFRRTVSAALDEAKLALKIVFEPTYDSFEPEIAGYSVANETATFLVHIVEYLRDFVEIRNLYNQFEYRLNNANPPSPSIKFEFAATDQAFEAMALEEVGYVSFWDSPALSKCQKTVAMSRVQFCKMIMFSPGEFHVNDGGIILNDGREFQAQDCVFRESRDGKLHVQICLDTYLTREFAPKSGNGASAIESSMIGITGLMVVSVLF